MTKIEIMLPQADDFQFLHFHKVNEDYLMRSF